MAEETKLVCTLPIVDMPDQLADWTKVRGAALETVALDNGVALFFPGDMETAVTDLAEREAQCCAFLQLKVATDGERVRLEVTSSVAGAQQVIATLVGLPA